jgi:hypothetical protein
VEKVTFVFSVFVLFLHINFNSKIGIFLSIICIIKLLSICCTVLLLKFRDDILLKLVVYHFEEKILSERTVLKVDAKCRGIKNRIEGRPETSEF